MFCNLHRRDSVMKNTKVLFQSSLEFNGKNITKYHLIEATIYLGITLSHHLFLPFFGLSVMSDCSRPHGLQPTKLLCQWDFPGKSTGVGCHCLLQGLCYLQLNTVPNQYRCYHWSTVLVQSETGFSLPDLPSTGSPGPAHRGLMTRSR